MSAEPRIYGMLAEYSQPESLIHAIEETREKGYRRMDAYTPYPIHEVIHALHLGHSKLPLLVLIGGLIGCFGHILVINAMKRAPASVLAPFQYLEIVTGTTFGVIIFDEFPSPITWIGIAIIIGSGLYIFYRESRLAQAA